MNADRCPHAEDAAAFVNDELPPQDAAAFEAHLAGCEQCRETIAATRALFVRLRSAPPVESARDLTPGILARI